MSMNKKQEVGLRLKQFRESVGISQKTLAERCGWGASRIGNYEAGVRSINLDDAEILAKNLHIQPYQIMFDENEIRAQRNIEPIEVQPTYQNNFPVLSAVQAGQWTEACEPYTLGDIEEWHETTVRTSPRSFWLRVQGESMTSPIGLSIPEGTLVLIDTEKTYENKSLVVAKLTDVNEATFKQYISDSGRTFLKPLNPNYPILSINENCRIIGVAVDAKLKLT
ncbi:LexA family protein [Vibrio algivorus]|uniref:Helix-turn-helix domain-containing protein n=1 Tax=Vibrio algivorus TaxID=1667024 RepID=A0A557P9P0_9VIBR|nr:S24 family peptidase [Vibrio algivorus]TVO37373.1 helix-turn-helix domain-containing protein [Vibrio algivorus]